MTITAREFILWRVASIAGRHPQKSAAFNVTNNELPYLILRDSAPPIHILSQQNLFLYQAGRQY